MTNGGRHETPYRPKYASWTIVGRYVQRSSKGGRYRGRIHILCQGDDRNDARRSNGTAEDACRSHQGSTFLGLDLFGVIPPIET